MSPGHAASSLELNVRRMEKIPAPDAEKLFEWGQDLWSIDCYQLAWRRWVTSFVGYIQNGPVSHVGVLTHAVSVAEREVSIGGMAAVLTLPAARSKGYGALTLDAATCFLRESDGVSFALLFCRDQLIPFYGPQGWRRIEDPVLIQQPDGERPSPLNCLHLSLDGTAWPSGAVRLNSQPW